MLGGFHANIYFGVKPEAKALKAPILVSKGTHWIK
jgi:hypothetical protein